MWYRVGTISVTNGSATVTGSGTQWVTGAAIGEALYAPDGRLYEITNVASDTSLTITPVYNGATLSGQSYVIVPSQSYIRDLASQAAELINNYATFINTVGQGKYPDGSLADLAFKFADDLDTGFYRSAANEVTFVAGGVAQFKYNASGLSFVGATALDLQTLKLNGTTVTATAAELNILDGATVAVSELNVLDGITATTAELNILDGVTATASEINVLDGITATTTELNHTDGVTSNIQTQLNSKAPIVSPTFTGLVTADEVTANIVIADLVYSKNLNSTGSFTWDSSTSTPSASINVGSPIVTKIHELMRGCVLNANGTVNYYLDANDWSKKEDGTSSDLTGADGNVMVEIPLFYYEQYVTGTNTVRQLSLFPLEGYVLHPAFIKDGAIVPFRYYGAYDACYLDATDSIYKSGLNLDDMTANLDLANDKLASVKGVYPLVGVTRNEARTLAKNVGAGWRQLDFDLWSAVQMLFVVEHQSFFSQNILGAGNTNGSYLASSANQTDSPHTIAGAGDGIANGSTNTTTGAGVNAKPGTSFMKYRGIENLYGNCWNWADGINVNIGTAGTVYVTNNAANWADNTATNYDLITSSLPTASGYISDLLSAEPYFLSSSNSGGSSSTYMTDYHFASTATNRVVPVGGAAFNGASAGAFCLVSGYDSSFAYRDLGARLAF